MKIYALYYKDTFVVAFPSREDCIHYGKQHYDGWDCNILERWIYESKQYTFSQPLTQPIPCTPYTLPTPLKTTPYEPNIWCEVKGPKTTYDNGPYAPGTK